MAVDREWVEFASRADMREWLARNHASSLGVWAVYPKSSTGESDLSWAAVVEECLCVGWIDSLPGKVDERRTRTYISPRKPRSGWSRRNKEIVEQLIASELMRPAGLQAVEVAQSNGSWTLFDAAEDMVIPDVLTNAFAEHPGSEAGFASYPDRTKKAVLQWIYTAQRSETQRKRADLTAAAAAEGLRPPGF